MPRYYFHSQDGFSFTDEEGTDLPNAAAAQVEAARHMAEMLRERAEVFWSDPHWTLTVAEEGGRALFTIRVEAGPPPPDA
jgi:hypothetical protein